MKIVNFFKLSLIFCFLIMLSCIKNPMERLERSARDFVEGKIKDISIVEDGILKASSSVQIARGFSSDKKVAAIISENSLNFLYPFRGNIYPKTILPLLYAASANQFVISDGETVEWYSESGLLRGKEILGDDKLPILAIALVNNNIIFFRDMHLWEYDIKTSETTRLSDRKFTRPYDRLFNVWLLSDGQDIGIMIGYAGFYYFSVFDYENKNMLITNIRTASSRVSFINRKVKYLSASSAGWRLTEMDVITKNKTFFQVIRDIEDIKIFDDIVFVEHQGELYIYDFETKKLKVPFNFDLSGGLSYDVFILYSGKVFVCDPIKFSDAIDLVLSIIPDLSEEKEESK